MVQIVPKVSIVQVVPGSIKRFERFERLERFERKAESRS